MIKPRPVWPTPPHKSGGIITMKPTSGGPSEGD